MEIKLNSEEIYIVREVLKQMKIRKRTGELGIYHGLDRFVSSHIVFRKSQLDLLDQTLKKFGIVNGISRIED